ncbi:MAG: helix-turn-helix transcriptional regulator [Candidatus Berkelbacteria bacterium]|nr:helix-turn-helix transcriptional regulator [Candidatus Berkelbacteria bacterium]
MDTFPKLLKKIRNEADLTQEDLARVLEVSTVLIAMVETGRKEVSKNFIERLAKKMGVSSSSITPFIFISNDINLRKLSGVEKKLLQVGGHLQDFLIKKKAKNLKKYV